ncbi:Clavaminate synthase-like protein [Backusella circina FSU 941]|nr:Clavaminate synthase-like protein [Backusella circina FSU 941]
MDNDNVEIPYYEEPPSYQSFLEKHLKPNIPALIGPALTKEWKARKEWVVANDTQDEQSPRYKPNYDYLRQKYGATKVQVARCNKRHFTDQERSEMTFTEFSLLWHGKEPCDYYLKDWHFVKALPEEKVYTVPDVFKDDWLNEYWLSKSDDDYKFSYMGGDTTFTPLHADVYRSYSWSSNICGIKKWTMFPPNQEDCFKDKFGNMVYDVRHVDPSVFPHFEKAKKIVLYQRDGETLFVPSGWFHQVENIGSTISINHNWFNACNIEFTYQSLKGDLRDVREAISDLTDMMSPLEFTEQCQQLLLAHSGWDWSIFLNLLACISHRLCVQSYWENQPPPEWQAREVKRILEQWVSDESATFMPWIESSGLNDVLFTVFKDINNVLENK